MTSGVSGIVDEAWERLRAGDERGAIAVLGAITDEYLEGWTFLDDSNGEVSGVFDEIAHAWTEVLLSADLSTDDREALVDRLDVWAAELEDYGVEAFWQPLQAARQGWDHPRIQAALRGEYDPWANANDDELVFDAPLIDARLNVLERRGDFDAFLNLARLAQHHARHAAMLARLGRIEEASTYAHERLEEPGDAHTVATALWEQGAQEEALALAEYGLTLSRAYPSYGEKPKLALAIWLREQAENLGRSALALKAAVVAFQQSPDLPSYRKVQELAGPQWPEQRAALLEELRLPGQWARTGHVSIWLHEGLIDEAIAEVERRFRHSLARAGGAGCRRNAAGMGSPGLSVPGRKDHG